MKKLAIILMALAALVWCAPAWAGSVSPPDDWAELPVAHIYRADFPNTTIQKDGLDWAYLRGRTLIPFKIFYRELLGLAKAQKGTWHKGSFPGNWIAEIPRSGGGEKNLFVVFQKMVPVSGRTAIVILNIYDFGMLMSSSHSRQLMQNVYQRWADKGGGKK